MFTTLLGDGLNIILDPIFLFVCKWGIHDKPDIGFDATDFYVGFIRCENIPLFVGILVDKGLNADGGSFAIVGNLLM